MSYAIAAPEIIASASSDLASIGSTLSAASTAAAAPTTGLLAAAEDEVSAATAQLFGTYAKDYQAVLAQAAAFHEEFAAALASAGNAYAAAEAVNASAISGALGQLTSPIHSLLVGAPGTPTPNVMSPLTAPTVALVMGGSGEPIPPPPFVEALNYLNLNFSPIANAQGLFTPEGLYPLTGVKTLPLDVSVSQGVQILDTAIKQQLAASPTGSVAVFGASESAIIASLEMHNLANPTLNPHPPTANQLGFTLIGDQVNPNGGILARFPGFPAGSNLSLPSLGITFYGATPSNTIYPTQIYTLEYDGFADFPQYPINFISDLNAFAGILFVHSMYVDLNPSALPPGYAIQQLPTSPGYAGVTNYYMMTTPNGLPLLEPLRAIPVIGNPLADLLQPDLTTIVNLGYGNPNYGWSQGPADVQTYFGLFPHVSQQLIAQDLIAGAHQGATAFVSDIHAEAAGVSLSNVSHSLASMTATGEGHVSLPTLTSAVAAALSPDSIIGEIQGAVTNVANGISGTAANLYAIALPTADIANVVVTVLPAYDINLFLSGIQQAIDGNVLGGLQYALVAPLAADTALLTMAGGFELLVVASAL
ncbi:MAG: PE family protein [Mycobacterium sp.]|uniref:PE family protein n=1 Tax=Mycobacterium sp. TaxID=1785 RepID=UPI003F9EAC96